jgi:hypothetical protein
MMHAPHRQFDFLEASDRAGELLDCRYGSHDMVPVIFYGAEYTDRIFVVSYNYVVLPR